MRLTPPRHPHASPLFSTLYLILLCPLPFARPQSQSSADTTPSSPGAYTIPSLPALISLSPPLPSSDNGGTNSATTITDSNSTISYVYTYIVIPPISISVSVPSTSAGDSGYGGVDATGNGTQNGSGTGTGAERKLYITFNICSLPLSTNSSSSTPSTPPPYPTILLTNSSSLFPPFLSSLETATSPSSSSSSTNPLTPLSTPFLSSTTESTTDPTSGGVFFPPSYYSFSSRSQSLYAPAQGTRLKPAPETAKQRAKRLREEGKRLRGGGNGMREVTSGAYIWEINLAGLGVGEGEGMVPGGGLDANGVGGGGGGAMGSDYAGFGNWTMSLDDAGVQDAGGGSGSGSGSGGVVVGVFWRVGVGYERGLGVGDVEVGVSLDAPIHSLTPSLPLLGDTTSTQSLLLSPLLLKSTEYIPQPSYPNYTLSSPLPMEVDVPGVDAGGNIIPLGLVGNDSGVEVGTLGEKRKMFPLVVDTEVWDALGGRGLGGSMCAIRRGMNVSGDLTGFGGLLAAPAAENITAGGISNVTIPSTNTNLTLTLTDLLNSTLNLNQQTTTAFRQRSEGWRWEWVTSGLGAGRNYSVWVVEEVEGLGVGTGRGRLSGVVNMVTKEDTFPCPLVHGIDLCPSIAYAAPLNTTTPNPSTITSLPPDLESTLSNSLKAFSTSLLTTACGRDLYSPVSTCKDCFDEYREWLCRTVLPRCASAQQVQSAGDRANLVKRDGKFAQVPMTVKRPVDSFRTPSSARPTYKYDELLPCMSMCRRVDRKCPVFVGFRCPVRGINANESYAYCGPDEEDRGRCEGEASGGADRWGNVWCNGMEDWTNV